MTWPEKAGDEGGGCYSSTHSRRGTVSVIDGAGKEPAVGAMRGLS